MGDCRRALMKRYDPGGAAGLKFQLLGKRRQLLPQLTRFCGAALHRLCSFRVSIAGASQPFSAALAVHQAFATIHGSPETTPSKS